jgi:hypothetical protein
MTREEDKLDEVNERVELEQFRLSEPRARFVEADIKLAKVDLADFENDRDGPQLVDPFC